MTLFIRLIRILLAVGLCGLCLGAVWLAWNIVSEDILRRERAYAVLRGPARDGATPLGGVSDTATPEEAAWAVQRFREQSASK